MRRWLTLGPTLLLAAAVAAPSRASDSPAYRTLGDMAVMDQGRIKPLHTFAINKVKSIYSRQTIKLYDEKGEVREKWDPVAAIIDWGARPEYWDEQEFIRLESSPLMSQVLAGKVKAHLNTLAAKPATSAADRDVLTRIAAIETPTAADLKPALTLGSLSEADRRALEHFEARLSGAHKWVSPGELENAEVTVNGRRISFTDWFGEVMRKQGGGEMEGSRNLTDLEGKVAEVGARLFYYQAIRDHNQRGVPSLDLDVVPRPSTAEYLKFTGEAYKKDVQERGVGLTPLEQNASDTLADYLEDLQPEDRDLPGNGNAKFDERFTTWLREKSQWVPLRVLLESEDEELARAGFPAEKVAAFRTAFREVEEAEKAAPARLPQDRAQALVTAAADLSRAMGKYPPAADMARESHYNRFSPFYRAPFAFGVAVFALLLCVGLPGTEPGRKSAVGKLGSALYGLGMAGFLAGIALTAYGFYLRVRISGWAPVTSMEESVVWVAMTTAVIGLVLELVGRKRYPALAGAGMALLATILAVNVPMLDPQIKALQPVLRSNYWLTIHVLTIVSSYAAFALALGLGLLAVGYYLTASYRRTATLAELSSPLVLGLPVAAIGGWGLYASYHNGLPSWLMTSGAFYAMAILTAIGGMLSVAAAYAAVGELANRRPAGTALLGLVLLSAGSAGAAAGLLHAGPAWLIAIPTQYVSWTLAVVGLSWSILALFGAQARATLRAAISQVEARDEAAVGENTANGETVSAAVASAAGGVATLTRPTVSDIRARIAGSRPKLDARGQAMQATAARIKPLANFVYRAMQVGVLLCAAGTILGGVWADYSWGRFWGWDPKEVWALITLLVYLVPLHGRFAGWVNTFGLVMASVVCFMSVLMAWYGVNFVLGVGLHSYGFVEGGGQGIVISCALAVLAVACGAAWRRWRSSRVEPVVA
jgi:ABC-type transport system involved in cytochrome c biogenesis permease subunit